jgi:hypothetical protein
MDHGPIEGRQQLFEELPMIDYWLFMFTLSALLFVGLCWDDSEMDDD